jgi:hypothetical protein
MYYRIAIQLEAQPPWKWQSTVLSSLGNLLQWLQVYRAFPQERLRFFSCASLQDLNEQLARENQGLVSASVLAVLATYDIRRANCSFSSSIARSFTTDMFIERGLGVSSGHRSQKLGDADTNLSLLSKKTTRNCLLSRNTTRRATPQGSRVSLRQSNLHH